MGNRRSGKETEEIFLLHTHSHTPSEEVSDNVTLGFRLSFNNRSSDGVLEDRPCQ